MLSRIKFLFTFNSPNVISSDASRGEMCALVFESSFKWTSEQFGDCCVPESFTVPFTWLISINEFNINLRIKHNRTSFERDNDNDDDDFLVSQIDINKLSCKYKLMVKGTILLNSISPRTNIYNHYERLDFSNRWKDINFFINIPCDTFRSHVGASWFFHFVRLSDEVHQGEMFDGIIYCSI